MYDEIVYNRKSASGSMASPTERPFALFSGFFAVSTGGGGGGASRLTPNSFTMSMAACGGDALQSFAIV